MSDPSQVTLHEIKTNENWKILAEKKYFSQKLLLFLQELVKKNIFANFSFHCFCVYC